MVVVLVYILVQIGLGKESTIWLINEGREYIEALRWADIGIFVGTLVAYALIKIIGAKRKIVEMWLWIEVLMLFDLGFTLPLVNRLKRVKRKI
ncbi:MAG: hypothetical protein KU29_08825 [Sulfurovum sp. FS06-10]|nr:MAG: hypothetical protein KU29_08825 [Sulfurovum sp. FS06-10]